MKESGVDAGARNFGRLCLAMIPWVLGIGVSMWLGVWAALSLYHEERLQEERAAIFVGSGVRPTAKIKIDVILHDCLQVSRADVDGSDLYIYAKNQCHQRLDYAEWHWQILSPNGTVLKSGYTNFECPIPVEPEDQAECKLSIDDDERGSTLRVWTQK